MIRAIIIDDEEIDRELLTKAISQLGVEVEIVATCDSVSQGVKAIKQFKPDIVFSDIDMPVLSGLQLLDFLNEDEINFELIFITAFSEFAVKAFQLSAIDYLLKPIDIDLLKTAINKVVKKQNVKQIERNYLLKENLSSQQFEKIALSTSKGVNFVNLTDIIYFKADNVYTEVYFQNEKQIIVSKPIREFEKILPTEIFFRSHRSFIININFVKEYIKSEGGDIILKNGISIPLSRDRRIEFNEYWKKILK